MVGAPSTVTKDAGTWANVMNWALPQMGWTLAADDITTNGQVAYTNASGTTYAFFDSIALPENAGAYNVSCAVRMYQDFIDFSSRGSTGSALFRYISKLPTRSDQVLTDAGYRLWGDADSVIVFTWTQSAAHQASNSLLGRPRYMIHYLGKVSNIAGGSDAQVFMGSSVSSTTNSAAPDMWGINSKGPFPAMSTLGSDLYFSILMNRLQDAYLSSSGSQTSLVSGERHITPVLLSPDSNSSPPVYKCRGLYAGVGDWRTFIQSADDQALPSLLVDVGERSLTPYACENGHGSTPTTYYWSNHVFIDQTGTWS
jgi:hypothetical protein